MHARSDRAAAVRAVVGKQAEAGMDAGAAPPRSFALTTWFSGGSLLIVLAALAIMAVVSGVVVDRMTQREGLARSQLAVSAARDFIRRLGESNTAAARTLAENPTLQRLVTEPADPLPLGIFLRNYCETVRASACAVTGASGVLSSTGGTQPWSEVATARAEQGERFALAPKAGGPPLLGAAFHVGGRDGPEAVVLQALAGALLDEAGRQSGSTVRVQNISSYRAPDADPLTPLHTAALAGAVRTAAQVPALDSYAASALLQNSAGEPVALIDALLPAAGFNQTAATYRHVVIAVTLLVAALAGLAGLLAARWLSAPVIRLADMARRIGQGDFSPAMPSVEPRELNVLAHAMDEMRQNLIELTDRLRRREAEVQAVLDGVVEGVYVTDEQRVIRYANPQFARMLRQEPEAIIGRFCGDVLHPSLSVQERPCARDCPIVTARQSGAARSAESLRLGDGTVRSAVVVSAPPNAGRQVQLLRDETDLEAARRARDSVLGNISHEFRTPLAAQLAAVELLREGIMHLQPAEQLPLLANVERGVLRLMRLIDNLLESVRIESGQLALRGQLVDIEHTVREAVELLQPLLLQRQLRVETDLAGLHARRIYGDAQRLQQVFVNLLSNAIKFAPVASAIRVGGGLDGRAMAVWVEDEGPGPPAGDRDALFERFRRAELSEPDTPGLGLGLWIVRSIIERHSGQVRVERTANGRTRFVLSLPLESPVEDTAG